MVLLQSSLQQLVVMNQVVNLRFTLSDQLLQLFVALLRFKVDTFEETLALFFTLLPQFFILILMRVLQHIELSLQTLKLASVIFCHFTIVSLKFDSLLKLLRLCSAWRHMWTFPSRFWLEWSRSNWVRSVKKGSRLILFDSQMTAHRWSWISCLPKQRIQMVQRRSWGVRNYLKVAHRAGKVGVWGRITTSLLLIVSTTFANCSNSLQTYVVQILRRGS